MRPWKRSLKGSSALLEMVKAAAECEEVGCTPPGTRAPCYWLRVKICLRVIVFEPAC